MGLIKVSQLVTYPNTTVFGTNASNMFMFGADTNSNSNFKYNLQDLLPKASSVGSGAALYKDITSYTQLNFKSLTAASNKVSITSNTNDVALDVVEANLGLNNISGTLSLAKGGTGQSLSDPGGDKILFWDDSAGAMTWLGVNSVNSGLGITGQELSVQQQVSSLGSKGDLVTYNGSTEVTLPVGADSYILKANSATGTGLEWVSLGDYNFDTLTYNDNFLGVSAATGRLRTDGTLSWTDNTAYQNIGVNVSNLEPLIDLDNCDNTTSNFPSVDTITTTTPSLTFDTEITINIGGTQYKIQADAV